ncbi:hypothetical protein M758_10G038600 [Ceratodon purpureus]|nr:hypothetical protein M758_10G038600 [Ceratodon purpureus]
MHNKIVYIMQLILLFKLCCPCSSFQCSFST